MPLGCPPTNNKYFRNLANVSTKTFQMILRTLKAKLGLHGYGNSRKQRYIAHFAYRDIVNYTIPITDDQARCIVYKSAYELQLFLSEMPGREYDFTTPVNRPMQFEEFECFVLDVMREFAYGDSQPKSELPSSIRSSLNVTKSTGSSCGRQRRS